MYLLMGMGTILLEMIVLYTSWQVFFFITNQFLRNSVVPIGIFFLRMRISIRAESKFKKPKVTKKLKNPLRGIKEAQSNSLS